MSVRDVSMVAGSISQIAGHIEKLGHNYYKVSSAWKTFPSKVNLLVASLEELKVDLERHQQSLRDEAHRALQEVEKLVKAEESKLKKRDQTQKANARGAWRVGPCCGRVRFTEMVFPESIHQGIDDAVEVFKSIEKHISTARENEEKYKSAAVTKCHSLTFANHNNDSYVSREETEEEIYAALNTSVAPSPTVVLIYGAGGEGKSTVARQVGWKLGQTSQFDRVLLVECGRLADVSATQTALLQRLRGDDFSSQTLLSVLGSEADLTRLLLMREGEDLSAKPGSREKLLQSLLHKQKLLIILDDVPDSKFLLHFLQLSGPNVKYVITSRTDVCSNMNYTYFPIKMKELNDDGHKRILAVHAGLPGQSIPDHCKGAASNILSKAHRLPLAIAAVAVQVKKAGNHDLTAWKSVEADFNLDERPAQHVHNAEYGYTVWAVIRQNYDSCGPRAQQLLLVLAMCRGPSIPSESILQFLYSRAFPTDRGTTARVFKQTNEELRSWQLVSKKDNQNLSLHPLYKECILEKMKEEVDDVAEKFFLPQQTSRLSVSKISGRLRSIAGDPHAKDGHLKRQAFQASSIEDRFGFLLSCLYLDPDFGRRIASQIGFSFDTFNELKRSTIEPITDLVTEMMFRTYPTPTESCTSAIEVFLHFICNDSLNDHHISHLLDGSDEVTKTLRFLENASLVGESFWEKNTISNISQSIVRIFQSPIRIDFHVQAANTLRELCVCSKQIRNSIVNTSGMLNCWVQFMGQDENPVLQSGVTLLLCYALYLPCTDSTILDQMIQTTKLMDSLKASLSKKTNSALQTYAAAAITIFGFSGDESTREQLVKFPGLLDALVTSVVQDRNASLARNAAAALCNLAAGHDASRTNGIMSTSELLEVLKASLSTNTNPELREAAVGAVAKFGFYGDDSTREQLLKIPGLLDALVKLVAQDWNAGLAREAVTAIRNLAASEDSKVKGDILRVPNLLVSLKAALFRNTVPVVQEQAAWALSNLGLEDESTRSWTSR